MAALITFVLPFFNEQGFIGPTLASLAAQDDRRFSLVLVDNASTDAGQAEAQAAVANMADIEVRFVREDRPGKLFALQTGMREAETPLLGTMDADTIYPASYVARVLALFAANPAAIAVLAFGQSPGVDRAPASRWLQAGLFPGKCLTGGFGQAFRRNMLERAGGYDPERWPYVLEDHEIVHRIAGQGPIVYSRDHVCHPSDRRQDRSDCSWNMIERALYKALPQPCMEWFFYRFLATRFERRGLRNIKLRDQAWREDRRQDQR